MGLRWVAAVWAAALISGVVMGAGAAALTPDLYVSRVAEEMARSVSDSAAAFYLAREREDEETNLLASDVVLLGVVETVERKQVPGVGGAYYAEVQMLVERCLKGPCGDRVRFTANSALMPGARYELGERALVILNLVGRGDGRHLVGSELQDKYLVDDGGVVVRKGIPVDQLIEEIEDLLRSRGPAELFERAGVVAVGEVMRIDRDDEETHLPIGRRTQHVQILLTEIFKGAPRGDTVTVVPPVPVGGGFDYVTFAVAETVLVFISERPDGLYEVVGGHDGKYRLGDMTTSHVLGRLREQRLLPEK